MSSSKSPCEVPFTVCQETGVIVYLMVAACARGRKPYDRRATLSLDTVVSIKVGHFRGEAY